MDGTPEGVESSIVVPTERLPDDDDVVFKEHKGESVIGKELTLLEILRTTGESDDVFATDGIRNCDDC